MPRVALALNLIFLLLAVGWRAGMQYRRSGDLGLRGLSPQAGRLEKAAALLLGVGTLGTLASPLLALTRVMEALPILDRPASHALGLLLASAGMGLAVLAEFQMGDSWRVGVDPSETTELIRSGLFGQVRNPIYSGMLLAAAGLFFLVPSVASAASVLVLTLAIQLQVRCVEEPYLVHRHGQAYRDYARSVGRFAPWLGRLA